MNSLIFASLVTLEFIGPCSVHPVLVSKVNSHYPSVGHATIDVLDKFEVNYQGSERGLNSAFGTPTGIDAMELISDTEMRSYGWCYDIDGKIPEVFPDEVSLSAGKRVRWFFGYAHYLDGKWVSQCEPAYKIKPAFLCSK